MFHEWEVFNTGQWSPSTRRACSVPAEMPTDGLTFILRTSTPDGNILTRHLALHTDLVDLYTMPWLRCVESITYDGMFPIAKLTYHDEDLSVEVTAELFSPFVPHESRDSGTPGFYVHFSVRNLTAAPVEVAILGRMMNAAGLGQAKRQPCNTAEMSGGGVSVLLDAEGLCADDCTTGNMAISVSGGEVSYLTGIYHDEGRKWLALLDSRYGRKTHSYLHTFRADGRLQNLMPRHRPTLPEGFTANALSSATRQRIFTDMCRHPFVYNKLLALRQVCPTLGEQDETVSDFLDDLASNLTAMRDAEWGDAVLCTSVELAPAATEDFLFTVSWYFPNHVDLNGVNLGHYYENRFTNAQEVNRYLVENFHTLRDKSLCLPTLLDTSSMDEYETEAISTQLSTLTKNTWWTKAGYVGLWEGVGGNGGLNTTDVSFYGSFPLIALFPDLAKKQMTYSAKFQQPDGRFLHCFVGSLLVMDAGGFNRVDLNSQFVMQVARDFQWSGDVAYLTELWPNVVLAMENTALLDGDGDGLPDHDTKHNTYDTWEFAGCPSFIAGLWMGALQAAIRLAHEMGDHEDARKWQDIFDIGRQSLESKLWNGEYYVLWRDESSGIVDECCMSDQFSADWFNACMGWGGICKPERIKKALRNVMLYNFQAGRGLFNATYPPGIEHKMATSDNLQGVATWTGIEYEVAALLMAHGMCEESQAIISDIHDRYLTSGRVWNHVECGNHYYRALSSWSFLLIRSGFRLDIPAGKVAFAPMLAGGEDTCTYPFFAPTVIGRYRQSLGDQHQLATLEIASGGLEIRELTLPGVQCADDFIVTLNDIPLACTAQFEKQSIRFTFDTPVTVQTHDIMNIGRNMA